MSDEQLKSRGQLRREIIDKHIGRPLIKRLDGLVRKLRSLADEIEESTANEAHSPRKSLRTMEYDPLDRALSVQHAVILGFANLHIDELVIAAQDDLEWRRDDE